ncbi:uncharacterized protein METZ01_LOCUS20114, partial [marine metagenome]
LQLSAVFNDGWRSSKLALTRVSQVVMDAGQRC